MLPALATSALDENDCLRWMVSQKRDNPMVQSQCFASLYFIQGTEWNGILPHWISIPFRSSDLKEVKRFTLYEHASILNLFSALGFFKWNYSPVCICRKHVSAQWHRQHQFEPMSHSLNRSPAIIPHCLLTATYTHTLTKMQCCTQTDIHHS